MKILGAVLLSVTTASAVYADPLTCNLSAYKATTGLTAAVANNELTLTWDGDRNQEVRMRFGVTGGAPTIVDLSVRKKGGTWAALATNATPDFRVTSGLRRMSNQQMSPLRGLGVELTNGILDKYRWEPFWDAPLDLASQGGTGGNPPPGAGVANQSGLPRKPEEIKHGTAVYKTTTCTVKTDGARLKIGFPGVQLGVFAGTLQYTIFKGTNLIQQEILATTQDQWVAYKYDAGLKGLSTSGARVAWKDIENAWKENKLEGAKDAADVTLKTASRLVIADRGSAGSICVFPPPHSFFWAREIAINLGYNWYRKDSDTTFALGVRQADHEDQSENQGNFALYSARPGSLQKMTVFLYPSVDAAPAAFDQALTFTHGDHYQPVAGYQVMNHHYHMDLGQRILAAGSPTADIPDLRAFKALGINIVSQVDSIQSGLGDASVPEGAVYPGGTPVTAASRAAAAAAAGGGGVGGRGGGGGRGGDPNATRQAAIDGAKAHSDSTFVVMPDQEFYGSPLGGHTDLLFSHPTYWLNGRAPGQPLFDMDPKYGKVYHIATAQDLMDMAKNEDVLINMPHPRTKGSTGFPDAIKDLPFFSDSHYQGVGFRWGMGLDRSEVRMCDYRCQPLFDDMNNWVADKPIPPKYILSISEVRHQQPGDEIYASSPVTYVKLPAVPTTTDMSPIIQALMRGDSFVTSGEVLMPAYAVQGTGNQRTISVDLDWTFPLDFVEVISGDGTKTDRQVISTTDLPAMGKKHWDIPFNASGKKWVRFAAWDSAGNGVMSQPTKLNAPPTPAAGGFTPLFDGKTLNNWVVDGSQYSKNFSVRDGLLRVEGEGGWLRSSRQYGDFTLRLGFRYLTDDPSGGRIGVSGVFLRTPGTSTYQSGWPDNSLEVQLANRQGGRPAIPGDARWGGAVLRHGNLGGPTSFDTRTALLSYGKTGDWQTLEIQAIGDAIHVTLNGNFLGTASAGGNARGFIGLQAETGGIEFRTVEINEGVKGLAPRTADGFVPLFDGKTLTGWTPEKPGSPGFDIVDGALVVRGRSASAPNRPTCNGSIWTEKAYDDFTLRYQARFETNLSVGGLFFRTPSSGGPVAPNATTTRQGGWNQIETRAMQDKLLPWNGIIERAAGGEQGDTVFDYRAATLAYAATEDWTKDWVNYEVQARGGRVAVWVNGFLVSKAEDVLPLKGIFGLQCERESVEYRNILIREMPPADERKAP